MSSMGYITKLLAVCVLVSVVLGASKGRHIKFDEDGEEHDVTRPDPNYPAEVRCPRYGYRPAPGDLPAPPKHIFTHEYLLEAFHKARPLEYVSTSGTLAAAAGAVDTSRSYPTNWRGPGPNDVGTQGEIKEVPVYVDGTFWNLNRQPDRFRMLYDRESGDFLALGFHNKESDNSQFVWCATAHDFAGGAEPPGTPPQVPEKKGKKGKKGGKKRGKMDEGEGEAEAESSGKKKKKDKDGGDGGGGGGAIAARGLFRRARKAAGYPPSRSSAATSSSDETEQLQQLHAQVRRSLLIARDALATAEANHGALLARGLEMEYGY